MGAATASVNFFRSNGGTVGTAAFLSILFTTAAGSITERLAEARHDPAYRRLLAQSDNAHALTGVLRPGGGVNLEDSAFLRALDPSAALPFLEGYVTSMRIASSPARRCPWPRSRWRPGGFPTSRSPTSSVRRTPYVRSCPLRE
jgi:hypothetical protein